MTKNKINVFQRYLCLLFISLISLTFFHCANMQSPTGGPKDSIAPKLLNVSPANYSLNFKEKNIVLQFDEYLKFNNQFKEFSISPDLDKQPDYKIKKKSLHITLPDSLEENTTYTINFGKGLVDFNEGNPFINYNYVFATGSELDSLSISGTVKNAFTKSFDKEKDKDVRVLLIPTRQDSIFGKKKANIFTIVDSTGAFKFNNLREDTYRIYAIKEQNNDRIYNNPDELIGFVQDSLVLNKNIENIVIEYSKGLPTVFRTLERKIDKDSKAILSFNQPLDSPSLTLLDPIKMKDSIYYRFNNNSDSAYIHFQSLAFDSLKFEIKSKSQVLDTILIRKSKNEKFDRTIIPKLNITNKVEKVNHIIITSDFPLENIDKSKLILNEDTVSRRNFSLTKDSILYNSYILKFNWKDKRNYELIIQKGALTSLYGSPNKELKTSFTLDNTENFGDIIFNIKGLVDNQSYIIELIDEKKEKVYDKKLIKGGNQIVYNNFKGGKYTLRIIKDLNNNGRWDGANVYSKTQAEPIWYLEKTFTIRANWEQTENIEVKFN